MNVFTKMMMKQRSAAYELNKKNILDSFSKDNDAQFIDLGCDDGVWTKKLAERIGTNNIYGIEIVKERAEMSEKSGINVKISDLNTKFPYEDNQFDIIHSNQVIEHVKDTDLFVSEIYRILKPGGYAVISTENLASWHNIGALFFGYMPFSLVNTTFKTAALGNPLAPHNNQDYWESSSWQHVRVFTTKGLKHLFELFGFNVQSVKGAGYYPFGNLLCNIDPWHSAFITFKIVKK